MKIYSIDVICPICEHKFRGQVLTDYKISGYREDFKPKFDDKEDLLEYYIWFCDNCHFSGYDERFNYLNNKLEFGEKIKNKILNLEKDKITLPYKFYRAGRIAEILDEDRMSVIDYYLKSYWTSKDRKIDKYIKKSREKISLASKRILDNIDNFDFEDIFVARYLMGYTNYEMKNLKQASYYFLDLVRMKHIPQKYKKYLDFAIEVLEEYDGENGFKT